MGTTNDGIFGFQDEDGTKWVRTKKGLVNCVEAGVYAGAGDQSTALQAAMNHSRITTLEMHIDGGGDIQIDSNIDCNGKILQFRKGTKLTGAGSLTNCVLSSELTGQIADTTVDFINFKAANDVFSTHWYGSKGDQTNDDTTAVQKTFDTIIANNKNIDIYFPIGNYKITSTITATFNATFCPKIFGAQKGRGNAGSTLLWYGSAGGTMMKFKNFKSTSFEDLDLTGNNGTGFPTFPKYVFHIEVDGASSLFSYFINFKNCSFSACGGTDSACLNLNGTGSYTNYQCSEITFEHCAINGNGFSAPTPSGYGIIVGGFNTKDFYINNCNIQGFNQAFFKSIADAGVVTSRNNLITGCVVNFDLSNGTHFQSIGDYTENGGMLLKAANGNTVSNYNIQNYYWASDNYGGVNPGLPETQEYIITGRGQLTIIGSAFESGATFIPKINWECDLGISSLTCIGCTFANIREGVSPFYSSGNEMMIQNRNLAYGNYTKQRITVIGCVGTIGSVQTKWFPNGSGEDYLLRGLVRMSAEVARPTTGRWNANDVVVNIQDGGDTRNAIKSWTCVRTGTFKTINVTGTTTAGSRIVTGVSNINAIEVGDYLDPQSGWGNLDYPYSVESVDYVAGSFKIALWNASASATVTFLNYPPKFRATGGGYGALTDRPTLTADDKGFEFYNTTNNLMEFWNGTTWIQAGGDTIAFDNSYFSL